MRRLQPLRHRFRRPELQEQRSRARRVAPPVARASGALWPEVDCRAAPASSSEARSGLGWPADPPGSDRSRTVRRPPSSSPSPTACCICRREAGRRPRHGALPSEPAARHQRPRRARGCGSAGEGHRAAGPAAMMAAADSNVISQEVVCNDIEQPAGTAAPAGCSRRFRQEPPPALLCRHVSRGGSDPARQTPRAKIAVSIRAPAGERRQ